MLDKISTTHKLIVTLEENVSSGGFGRAVCQYINDKELHNYVLDISLPDDYIEHGSVDILRRETGIDEDTIVKRITAVIIILEIIIMSSKERLDVLLVNRGLADSREKAKAIIMSGNVYVDGQKEDKAGSSFNETVNIEVRGNTLKYVSVAG